MIRLLCTGSRAWVLRLQPRRALIAARDRLQVPAGEIVVVHGANGVRDRWTGQVVRGLDLIVAEQARDLGMRVEAHPADWTRYGNAAGAIRNREMVALGAYWCLGFPLAGSIGTWDCMRRAHRAGIRVFNCADGELEEMGDDGQTRRGTRRGVAGNEGPARRRRRGDSARDPGRQDALW